MRVFSIPLPTAVGSIPAGGAARVPEPTSLAPRAAPRQVEVLGAPGPGAAVLAQEPSPGEDIHSPLRSLRRTPRP